MLNLYLVQLKLIYEYMSILLKNLKNFNWTRVLETNQSVLVVWLILYKSVGLQRYIFFICSHSTQGQDVTESSRACSMDFPCFTRPPGALKNPHLTCSDDIKFGSISHTSQGMNTHNLVSIAPAILFLNINSETCEIILSFLNGTYQLHIPC